MFTLSYYYNAKVSFPRRSEHLITLVSIFEKNDTVTGYKKAIKNLQLRV